MYNNLTNIGPEWIGIQTFIKIDRIVERKDKKDGVTKETAYYISSLASNTSAKKFNESIRNHWLIENSLHYVKDKTYKEDDSKIRKGQAPQNISVLRNIVINIFRANGYSNMAQAVRLLANDIGKMWQLMSA